jgi:CheY-like chemotaxis protein
MRVLLIDDDDLVRTMHAAVLADAGLDVVEAADGASGLAVAGTGFDLILLDVRMPGMTGYEVAKLLRADPLTSVIPFAFVSGDDPLTLQAQAQLLGAAAVIHKQDGIAALAQAVWAILQPSSETHHDPG